MELTGGGGGSGGAKSDMNLIYSFVIQPETNSWERTALDGRVDEDWTDISRSYNFPKYHPAKNFYFEHLHLIASWQNIGL